MVKRKDGKTEDRCPNCGYCPHCGQSAKPPQIVPRPYPVPWVYPYRPGTPIGPYYGEGSWSARAKAQTQTFPISASNTC